MQPPERPIDDCRVRRPLVVAGAAGSASSAKLVAFGYDATGLLASRAEGVGSSVAYTYDLLGRLETQADCFVGGSGDVAVTLAHNPADQVTQRVRTNDAYAWNGHVNVERAYDVNALNQYMRAGPAVFAHDGNGNLKSDGSNSYSYDVENRLVQSTGANALTLRYDPLGRLHKAGTTTFV
ncbi:MAG TPA: RHS repeat domain-containing protein [Allosphingosinicella sp.]|nr:RHS repeat domain-containing protein [Allosphingosinicella sp.]